MAHKAKVSTANSDRSGHERAEAMIDPAPLSFADGTVCCRGSRHGR